MGKWRLARHLQGWAEVAGNEARQRRATASAATQACLLACEERLAAADAQVMPSLCVKALPGGWSRDVYAEACLSPPSPHPRVCLLGPVQRVV